MIEGMYEWRGGWREMRGWGKRIKLDKERNRSTGSKVGSRATKHTAREREKERERERVGEREKVIEKER